MIPKTISIEITNNCNNSCLICPHGHNLIVDKGYMPLDMFNSILSQIESFKDNTYLELHGVGEPLLHPRINEFIKSSKKYGFTCSICSNAILLTETTAKKIADSGLDKLVISLETKENYERIRCTNIYDKVKENVIKTVQNHPSIEIEIYMIVIDDSDYDRFEEFKNQFSGNRIVFSQFRATDWCGTIPLEGLATKKGKYVRKEICPLFAKYCSIDYMGNVRHCYLDYNSRYIYGNLNESHFLDIWESKQRIEIMDRMRKGEYDQFEPCCDCVFPFVESLPETCDTDITDEDLNRPEMQLLSKIKQKQEEIR